MVLFYHGNTTAVTFYTRLSHNMHVFLAVINYKSCLVIQEPH